MSDQDARIEALEEEMRLCAELIGQQIRLARQEAGLVPVDFAPDFSGQEGTMAHRFFVALMGQS